jgi:hypothetical protein
MRGLDAFGYGRLIKNLPAELRLGQRLGSRPTLVVIGQPPGGQALGHPPQYYEDFFFNVRRPNSYAWVMESYGAAPIRLITGQIPIIDLTLAEAQLDMVPRAAAIMKRVVDLVGLSTFQHVDDAGKNDDIVTTVELLLVCIDTYSSDLAATRHFTYDAGGVKFDGQVSYVGHQASLMSICHEVLHQWGAVDLYGDGSKNFFLTSMAATIFGVPDDLRSVDLDPWHRMQFGLTTPVVVDFATQGSGSEAFPSVATDRKNSAVLFWDSRRGKQDFFMVELRQPTPGTVDSDVPDGFAVWVVQVDANGSPVGPGNGIPGVAALGKDLGQGTGAMWQGGDQTPALGWGDGSISALSLKFERSAADKGTVSWSTVRIRPPPFRIPLARVFEAPTATGLRTCDWNGGT